MELMTMKDTLRRWVTLLTLLGVVLWLPAVVGCGGGRPDPRANPEFNEETLDPTKLQMKSFEPPSGGPKQ
jgi:hypothetical protein